MIKILDPAIGWNVNGSESFRMFFDFNNPNDYLWYQDPECSEQVDIMVHNHAADLGSDIHLKYRYKMLLSFDIKHNYENQIRDLWRIHKSTAADLMVVNAQDPKWQHKKIVFNDYLFNRTKAYYLGYDFHPDTPRWYYSGSDNYKIIDHPAPELKNKIYIAPNNSRQGKRKFRYQLVNFLLKTHSAQGYIGDPSQALVLPSNRHTQVLGYSPPGDIYYQDTFINIYGETIEYGSTFAVTEKTFDPLIKGHFILPFGIYNFVKNTKDMYNFQFPEFIDYSYDQILDDESRYQAYQSEVSRLLSLDIDTWRQNWKDNQNVIKHNQQVFYDRPYHRIKI
jgi:hypothetical protein